MCLIVNFVELFLKKVDVKWYILLLESDDLFFYLKIIGGILVCDDNLIWVNYILYCYVKFFIFLGEVFKIVCLDDRC